MASPGVFTSGVLERLEKRRSLSNNIWRRQVQWKRECENLPFECLAASMRRNNQLRIMFATGYYDMACQIGQARYLARHGGYPKERVEVNEYPSGHMAYLGEDSAKMFADDVRAFVEK